MNFGHEMNPAWLNRRFEIREEFRGQSGHNPLGDVERMFKERSPIRTLDVPGEQRGTTRDGP